MTNARARDAGGSEVTEYGGSMTKPILSDSPEDLAALDASVRAINATLSDDLLPAHLNKDHGYTIPEGHPKAAWQFQILRNEHAAIHSERLAQEHAR